MSAAPGWYSDPGGQSGMFRYWDGRGWTASLAPNPQAPVPPWPALPPLGSPSSSVPQPMQPKRKPYGWMIGLLALLVALVVVVVVVVQRAGVIPVGPTGPTGQPSTEVCPQQQSESPQPQLNDGRVYGGKLSYPRLGSPWSAPVPEYGVAFGRGVLMQSVEIERSGTQRWLAAVLIGQLMAGDGFFTPKDGAAIVVKCVSGTFYGGSEVTRADKKNQAMKVDGHDAWIIESQLSFDVPGIKAKSELLIVVIVDTGDGSGGLFYASIPENAPELVKPARDALAALKVDG